MVQTFLLELGGQLAGRFFESRGGGMHALVATSGTGHIQRKHIAQVSYDDLILACGPGMSRDFYKWIASAFDGTNFRKGGAVISLDRNSNEISRLEFLDTIITAVDFPELNKSNPKPAALLLTLTPSVLRFATTPGKERPKLKLGVYDSPVAKSWQTSDFSLKIPGLEQACAQITRIQSMRLRDTLREDGRYGDSVSLKTEVPDIVLEVPKQYGDPFYQWFNDFVVRGNNTTAKEKQGTLDFLAHGSSSPYSSVNLSGLGIMGFSQNNALNSNEIKLYCESMEFRAGESAIR